MKKILDERGAMLPFIAFMLMILILFASFSIGTTMMFMQRKVVEDALDAAVLSVTMASVQEKTKPVYYYDYPVWVCTETKTRTDDEGNEYTVCVDGYYYVAQSSRYNKNYIYLKSNAGSVLRDYFERNLRRNMSDYNIKNINYKIEYDNERFLMIQKNLQFLDPPATWRGYELVGQSYNPSPWWMSEFYRSTNFMGEPEDFTMDEIEERIVRFPRWVKITATATVEVPSIMGGMLTPGGNTTDVNVTVAAVRELLEVDPPTWDW